MSKKQLHILISPLDWGLGHASRCVPIIRHLLNRGCRVTVAASGNSLTLLQNNFGPSISYQAIKGYNITYSKNPKGFVWKILRQIPKLFLQIKQERNWLEDFCKAQEIDGIISDNRYGLYHPTIHNIILTHQWQILSNISTFADRFLLQEHQKMLTKFDRIWIVDDSSKNLAGKLSKPATGKLNKPFTYIGHLSQLRMLSSKTEQSSASASKEILILLSGPEPARTQLLHQILAQAEHLEQYNFQIIAGSEDKPSTSMPHISILGLANTQEIEQEIAKADLVICRSGYSTLMDLIATQSKALCIPTPGQSEQEYLAEKLSAEGIVLTSRQNDLDLSTMIPQALLCKGFDSTWAEPNKQAESALDQWLSEIAQKKSAKIAD